MVFHILRLYNNEYLYCHKIISILNDFTMCFILWLNKSLVRCYKMDYKNILPYMYSCMFIINFIKICMCVLYINYLIIVSYFLFRFCFSMMSDSNDEWFKWWVIQMMSDSNDEWFKWWVIQMMSDSNDEWFKWWVI